MERVIGQLRNEVEQASARINHLPLHVVKCTLTTNARLFSIPGVAVGDVQESRALTAQELLDAARHLGLPGRNVTQHILGRPLAQDGRAHKLLIGHKGYGVEEDASFLGYPVQQYLPGAQHTILRCAAALYHNAASAGKQLASLWRL
jgi:hypothetical protein